MELKRILTALLGLPIVLLILFGANKYIFGITILAVSIMCLYEYFSVIKKVCKPIEWLGYISCIIIFIASILNKDTVTQIIMYGIPIIVLILFLHIILTDMKITIKDMAYTLLGIIYIPFFMMFLALIRSLNNGAILAGYALTISWSTDVFAYFIGKKWGKHKFSKVSPKKSVEGCIAGVLGAIFNSFIYMCIIKICFNVEYNYLYIIVVTTILSIISQIGDFSASSIKRFADTKDYGSLLPGHGGMLDRIDSVIFIVPFAYIAFLLV